MTKWIKAVAVLLVLCCAPAQANDAQGVSTAGSFDKVAAEHAYRDWYKRFHADMRTLSQEIAEGKTPDQARVNEIFTSSLVPDSRMVMFLADIAKHPEAFNVTRTDPSIIGWALIMSDTLERAVPAGQGGPFKTAKMIPSDTGSFAWYVTLHADSITREALKDPKIFKSYHLPPDGVLERNAYPFVLFRWEHDKLYCTSISRELALVVSSIHRMQLY